MFDLPLFQNNKQVVNLDDGQLRALLDEAMNYKCPKDLEGKSNLFKVCKLCFIIWLPDSRVMVRVLKKMYSCMKKDSPKSPNAFIIFNNPLN